MSENIWDKLSIKYDKLWVQKYSLTPTRKNVCKIIEELNLSDGFSMLDVGCGTGQLIGDLSSKCKNSKFFGIDKSPEMIKLAKAKNLSAEFFVSGASDMDFGENSFDIITCCHSFPYYPDKSAVVSKIKSMLKPTGYAIFIQASVNNFYDKIIMWGVEKTAEDAQYLSKKDFISYFGDFELIKTFDIKERFYMPTISGFVLMVKDEHIIS